MDDRRQSIRRRLESRSSRVWALLAGLAAALCLAACQPPPPNVLLISLDTVRRDHLSCYGYPRPTTPHIDAVAETGLLFTRAVAVSNWTLPTHASMLTGLYPRSHGAHYVKAGEESAVSEVSMAELAPSCRTLAEILDDAGYRTGAIVANSYFLQPKLGLNQGFHHYDFRQAGPPIYYRRAEEITDAALLWLAEQPSPFFLFLNYMDAHAPYLPPPPYDRRFASLPDHDGMQRRFGSWKAFNERTARVNQSGEPLSAEEAAFFRDQYDGELAYADAQVGRLLAWLRDRDRYGETLIVVTSDHGEAFGEHGVAGHGVTLYEHQLAIPLIVKPPFGQTAERIDSRVSQVDIFPTVLAMLGLAIPETTQGASLLDRRPRDRFAQKCSKRDGRWSLVVYRDAMKYLTREGASRSQVELYDLGRDPMEFDDLSDADASAREAFEDSLRRWLARTRPVPRADPSEVGFSESEKEALRALGYVD